MKTDLKIVVLCGGKFAFPSIQLLAFEKYLAGIAIGGEEKEARTFLQQEANKASLPFLPVPTAAKVGELEHWIRQINPDAVFCICFPYLLPATLLNLLPFRFINFHPGPLPEYRGPMPIFEVIRSNEKETALSIHLMNERYDEGAIILREPLALVSGETHGSLALKLADRASIAVMNIAEMIRYGTVIPTLEQSSISARYHPKAAFIDTCINWDQMHAKEIEALINACNPWNNGADTQLNNQPVKIAVAEAVNLFHREEPGTILRLDDSGTLHVACVEQQQLLVKVLVTENGIITADLFNQINKIGQKFRPQESPIQGSY
jgi:methionyl-tRNA formyltransferase